MSELWEILLGETPNYDTVGSVYTSFGATPAQVTALAKGRFGDRAQAYRRSTGGTPLPWNRIN